MELTKYDAAKQAVAACVSIDECRDWKDKAAALAAYARLARDEELENNARRIRARATRRIGELLLGIEDNKRGRHNSIRIGGGMKFKDTRTGRDRSRTQSPRQVHRHSGCSDTRRRI